MTAKFFKAFINLFKPSKDEYSIVKIADDYYLQKLARGNKSYPVYLTSGMMEEYWWGEGYMHNARFSSLEEVEKRWQFIKKKMELEERRKLPPEVIRDLQ